MMFTQNNIDEFKAKYNNEKEKLQKTNATIEKCKTLPPETLYYDEETGRRGKYGKAYNDLLKQRQQLMYGMKALWVEFYQNAFAYLMKILTCDLKFLASDTADMQSFSEAVLAEMNASKEVPAAVKEMLKNGMESSVGSILNGNLAQDIRYRLYAPYWISKVQQHDGILSTPLLGDGTWKWDEKSKCWIGTKEYNGRMLTSFVYALPPTKELIAKSYQQEKQVA